METEPDATRVTTAAEAADREWSARLDAAERRFAQVTSDAIERSLAAAVVQLGDYIDSAILKVAAVDHRVSPPGRLRRFIRRCTPLWLRRGILRGMRVAWWSVSLQLPRRLRQRREQLAENGRQVAEAARPAERAEPPDVRDLIQTRFRLDQPIATFAVADLPRTVSLVVNGLDQTALLGGQGTAVIIASLIAERLDARFRIITRTHRAQPAQIADMLVENGLDAPRDLDIVHAPPRSAESIPLGPQDVFLTNHWRTTRAILAGVRPDRVIQLLEDDERLRYGIGDDHLRCTETLSDGRLRLLIDGEFLFRSLSGGMEPLPHLDERAAWFTSAFPERLYHDEAIARGTDGRWTFLLCDEPPGLGPLYWRGLEAISRAIEDGILPRDEWRFTFLGDRLRPLRLPCGVVTEPVDVRTVAAYAALVRKADLGLSMTGTSVPSHSSLRLLASGAVVVTDVEAAAASQGSGTGNIVTTDLSVEGLCRSLTVGASLARDQSARAANYRQVHVAREWRTSLDTVIARCVEWIGS
jgi:hypothetical protein